MENVYRGSKAILLFLFMILIIQTAFGDKMAQRTCQVILFSMIILNSGKVTTYLANVTETLTFEPKAETTETSTTHTSSGSTHGGSGGSFDSSTSSGLTGGLNSAINKI